MNEQPNLFETESEEIEINKIIFYALGDFQSRGKILAMRELPLDRLRGAFKRATDKFEISELSDKKIAESLAKLGAKVVEVPSFVAKHPFRVTISEELADSSKDFYQNSLNND